MSIERDGTEGDMIIENAKKMFLALYLRTIIAYDVNVAAAPSRNRTIKSITESHCRIYFGFLKEHLVELRQLLRIPDRVVLSNRTVISGDDFFACVNSPASVSA